MSTPHRVELSSNGNRHKLVIDGLDLSQGMKCAVLTLASGELPTLVLDPLVMEVPSTELAEARVVVTESARQALIALGWIPPSD